LRPPSVAIHDDGDVPWQAIRSKTKGQDLFCREGIISRSTRRIGRLVSTPNQRGIFSGRC
jgi:hypothetical protein